MLYDGVCDLCHRGVAWVRARDRAQRFEFLPYQSPGVSARFPGLDPRALARELHVVSPAGEVRSGVDAAPWIFAQLPRWSVLARVLAWPVARGIARPIYGWIAARRRLLHRGALRAP
ncbi:MAG: thiol-disulfide oxidoreductase DCC family protein [Candidatus Eiseniibacteriota bacterium]